MKRVITFDNIRAFCVLWIVGFWHMIGYWNPEYNLSRSSDDVCQIITWTALAAFTYISGYFLGSKKTSSFNDILEFYKKRFKRFYVLFFCSCTSLFIAGIVLSKYGAGQLWFPNVSDYFLSIIGLSTYIGNPPATLWYFCMLMSFYFITPLLTFSDKYLYKIIVGSILILGFFFLELFLNCDYRNYLYFPFYLLGILKILKPNRMSIWKYILFLTLYIILCLYQSAFGLIYNPILIICESLIGIILLIGLANFISYFTKRVDSYLALISYSSMAAYLFHRQISGLFKVILPPDIITPLTTTLVYVPIIFVCGYFIQKIYDLLINRINK